MKDGERQYIALCKRRVEEKFQFEEQGGTLRQRDLEYLADQIEEKSGIRLSLSTLKRFWKKDYDQTPHPSTLDAIVSILGYRNWQEFKLTQAPAHPAGVVESSGKQGRKWNGWVLLLLIASGLMIFWLIAFRKDNTVKSKLTIKGPVIFNGNKTVSEGVPSTIVFNYDVSKVEADSFFFQQSWNEEERVRLDPAGHHYSNIYYYPGFHKAKLVANDSILKIFRVHVTTDGWLPMVKYSADADRPVYMKKDRAVVDGALHITPDDLENARINMDAEPVLSYYNIRSFDDTYSDNFSLESRIMCDSTNKIVCPGFEVVIVCEKHIFFVRLMGKGCERNIAVKMGEVIQGGIDNDLSALGRPLYQWQDLKVEVVHKKATIFLDKQPVYTVNFKEDFGKIAGLVYSFNGTGAIDYVRLRNAQNRVVYNEGFGK